MTPKPAAVCLPRDARPYTTEPLLWYGGMPYLREDLPRIIAHVASIWEGDDHCLRVRIIVEEDGDVTVTGTARVR